MAAPAAATEDAPIRRSYLDDIDDDDTPSASTSHAVGSATTAAAASHVDSSTAASVAPAAAPARSGLDDIDDDETTAPAGTNQSTAAGEQPNTAEAEVRRIQAAIAKDKELAAVVTVAPPANGVVTVAPPLAQPDYFSILGLAQPTLSLTGEGVWPVGEDVLKRAFKRLVLLIHPDKCPVDGAKDAFEAVKAAHTVLASDDARFDYLKAYTAFRRALALRSDDYLPPSATTATLDETLEIGRQLADAKKKQASSLAARLLAQSEAKRQAVLHGQAARQKAEDQKRNDELKRKVLDGGDSDKSSGSDSDQEMSIAEKIRRAKQGKGKKIRLL